MTTKRIEPKKSPPVRFDLGEKPERERRIKSLEGIAEKFGISRSVLLQKIADGDLVVAPVTDDELDDPAESFRQGWDDAMNGRVVSREEFRKRMRADAD